MKDNQKLINFIRLHTANSPLGYKSIHLILADTPINLEIDDTCQRLKISPDYYLAPDENAELNNTLEKVLTSLSKNNTVFLLLDEAKFIHLYSTFSGWRDRGFYESLEKASFTGINTNQTWPKARLFIVVQTTLEEFDRQMVTKLADYLLIYFN